MDHQKRIQSISDKIDTARRSVGLSISDSLSVIKRKKEELRLQEADVVELTKLSEVVLHLQEQLISSNIEFFNKFFTQGVRTVYHDREIDIIFELGDRGSRKTLMIYVGENKEDGYVKSELNKASGGGIRVLVSFLMQILVIVNRGMSRFLCMDEAFSAISSEYIESSSKETLSST